MAKTQPTLEESEPPIQKPGAIVITLTSGGLNLLAARPLIVDNAVRAWGAFQKHGDWLHPLQAMATKETALSGIAAATFTTIGLFGLCAWQKHRRNEKAKAATQEY